MLRPDEQLLLGHVSLEPQARKTLQTALGNRAVILDSESSNGLVATGATGAAVPVPYYPTSGATGGTGNTVFQVTQTAHGLSVGNIVRFDGTNYIKAQADSGVDAEVIGIVSAVANANTFTLITSGQVTGLTGLTAGSFYFLSPTTAGLLTATDPNVSGAAGQVSKPLFEAYSTTAGVFNNMRGDVLTSSPAAGFQVASLLSTTTGINAKTVANTTLYTPATGKTCLVTCVIVVPTAVTAITAGPTVGIGTNATPSNIFSSTALTALIATTQAFNFNAPGVLVIATNASPVLLGLNAVATGTAMTLTAYCFGLVV